ncbi:hypothetical protein EPN87_00520 [archaeon]|nr:MAG: hypothetical protein EPN87_00520 [archaeon]
MMSTASAFADNYIGGGARYISESDMERTKAYVERMVKSTRRKYGPIVNAFHEKGSTLTIQQVSDFTGRSVRTEKKYLERLYADGRRGCSVTRQMVNGTFAYTMNNKQFESLADFCGIKF